MKKLLTISAIVASVLNANQIIEIHTGWNLVGINENAPNMGVSNLIDLNKTDLIVTNINGAWKKYDPRRSYLQQFQSFETKRGYWVKANSDYNMTINGIEDNSIPNLKAGWNLVSLNSGRVDSILGDFASLGYNIDLIVTNSNGAWKKYDPRRSYLQQFQSFDKNKGYWIKTEKLAGVATTRDGYDVKIFVERENVDVSTLINAIANYRLDELPNLSNLFANVSNIVVSGTNNGQVIESSYIDPTDSSFAQALLNAKNDIDNGMNVSGGTSLYVYGLSEGGAPFIISEAKVYKVNDDGTKGDYLGTTSQTGYLYLSNVTNGEKVWVEKDGFFYSVQTINITSGGANYIFLTKTNADLSSENTIDLSNSNSENARLLNSVLHGWNSFVKKDNAGHGYFVPSNIRLKRGYRFVFQPVNSIAPLFESENLQNELFENGYNTDVLSIMVSGAITPGGIAVPESFNDMLEINTQYQVSLNDIKAVLGFDLDDFPRLKEKLLNNDGSINPDKINDIKNNIKIYKYTANGWSEVNSNDIDLVIDGVNSNDDNIKNIYHSNHKDNAAIIVKNLSSATLLVAAYKEAVNQTPSVTYHTYGLNVKVVDEHNNPLPNALVKMRRGVGGVEVINYTDGNGTAHFDVLAAEGAIENIAINGIEGSHYPVSRVISVSSLNEDQNTTITLQMEEPPVYGTVKGKVTDIDTNESVVNAKVKLIYPLALADVKKDAEKIIDNKAVKGLEVGLVPNAKYRWYIKAHSDIELPSFSNPRVSTQRWILVKEATAAEGGNFLPYNKIVAQALAAPRPNDPADIQIIPTGQFDIAVEVDHDIDADGQYDFVELAKSDANLSNLPGEEFASNPDNNYGRILGFISTSVDLYKLINENAGALTEADDIYVDLNNSGSFTAYDSVSDLGDLDDYTIASDNDGSGGLLGGTVYNVGDNIRIDFSQNEQYILVNDETHHQAEHEIINTTWKAGISTTLKDTDGNEHYFVLKKVGNDYEWVEKITSGIKPTDDNYLVDIKSGEFAGIEYDNVGRFISQNAVFKKLAEKISDLKNELNLNYDLQNENNTIVEDGFTLTLVPELEFNITSDTTSVPAGTQFKIRKKADISLGGGSNNIKDYIKLDQVIVDRPVLTESTQITHSDRVGLYQFSAVPLSYGELNAQESLLRVDAEKLGYYQSPVVNVPKFTRDNTNTENREDVARVDLTMKVKPTYEVDVNVTDTNGNPVDNAVVIIDGVKTNNTDLEESEALEAKEGSFVRFENVIGGRGTTRIIRVSVPDSNYIPVIKTLRNLNSNKIVNVELVSTDQIADFAPEINILNSSINYHSGIAQISAEIIDKNDGTTTVAPENIYITNNGDVVPATINQDGTVFNISMPLNVGENQIRIETANSKGISRSNTIYLDYNPDVGSAAGRIRGITDENGDGLVDNNRMLLLDIFDENGLYINTAIPSSDGRYILEDLEADKTYKLQAIEIDLEHERIVKVSNLVSVTIPRGEVFNQDIVLNPLPQDQGISGAPVIDLIGDLTQAEISPTGEMNVSFTVSNFDLNNGGRVAVVVNDFPYEVSRDRFNSNGNYAYNVQNFPIQLTPGANVIYVVAQNPDGSFDWSADQTVYWEPNNTAVLASVTINAVDENNTLVPVQIELDDNQHNFVNAAEGEGVVEFNNLLSGDYYVNIYPLTGDYTPVIDYNVTLHSGSNEINITVPREETTIEVPPFYISTIDLNETEFAVDTNYTATVVISGEDTNYSVDNGYIYNWSYRYVDENGNEVIQPLPCNTDVCQFSIPVTGWVDLDVNVSKGDHTETGGIQIYIQDMVIPRPPMPPQINLRGTADLPSIN